MGKQDEVKVFNEFDEYYKATNGVVRSKHPDFNVYKLSEIGGQIVAKMEPFKMNYFHMPLHRKLNTSIRVFGNRLISEEYAQVIFKPGQIIEWERNASWEGYVIDVKESFLDFLIPNATIIDHHYLLGEQTKVIILTEEDYYALSYLYELIYNEYKNFDREAIVVVKNLLSALLIYIRRLHEKKNSVNQDSFRLFKNLTYFEMAARYKSYVVKEYMVSKSVQYYSSKLNTTPDFLNKCVKETYNKTAKEVINEVLTLHIKTVLTSSDVAIKEIAYQLNFDDYSHFVKFFKSQTGFSPAEFRNKHG